MLSPSDIAVLAHVLLQSYSEHHTGMWSDSKLDDYWPSVIIHFWMIFSICNNHLILDDSSHPFLDVVIYHPILDDSSRPFLDDLKHLSNFG